MLINNSPEALPPSHRGRFYLFSPLGNRAHSVPPVLLLPGQYLAHQQYRHLRQESVRGRGIRQQVRDGAHSGNHRLTQYPVVAPQYRANGFRHQWLYQPLSGFYRADALREDSHHRDQGRPSVQ